MTWVSILTPIHNGIEFLEECALSVCLQNCSYGSTSFTWEWWIGINGHGTGGEALEKALQIQKVCNKHIGENIIHVVNLPHVNGKVGALNALTAKSKGEWIAVLDCDDTWERDKLIFQRMTIQTIPSIDVLGTFCKYFGEFTEAPILPKGILTKEHIWTSNPIINSSVILRRENAYWEDRFGLDDYDMWLRLSKRGLRFFNIPYYLVNHRIYAGSAFNGKGQQNVEALIQYHRQT
jgi:glycosyltransferase involved in cell wall biosynthesis